LWSQAPHGLLAAWVVTHLLLAAARAVLVQVYHRAPAPELESHRWGILFCVGVACAGTAWGALGLFAALYLTLPYQLFVAFVIGGMAIGAIAATGSFMPAFLAFLTPAALPLVLGFVLPGESTSVAIGALAAIFAAALYLLGRNVNASITQSLALSLEKSRLVKTLQEANERIAQSNRHLSEEAKRHQRTAAELRESEALYRDMFEKNEAVKLLVDPESGAIVDANHAASQFYGYPLPFLKTKNISDINTRPREQIFAAMRRAESEAQGRFTFRHRLASGEIREVEVHSGPVELRGRKLLFSIVQDITKRKQAEEALQKAHDHLEQKVEARTDELLLANEQLSREIEERERAEAALKWRSRILERLAAGASLQDTLSLLVRSAEQQRPGLLCSVLLLDKEKKRLCHGAASSLPDFYNGAIDGIEIGPGVGSCGTAAYTGDCVIVSNVQTHPNWVKFRALAQQAGVSSCWSQPIVSSSGEILGTLSLYDREPREPSQGDLNFLATAAQLAGITIEHKRAQEALFEEKERAQVTLHSIGDAVVTTDASGVVEYLNPTAENLTGWRLDEARGKPIESVFAVVDEREHRPAANTVTLCLEQRCVVDLEEPRVLLSRDGQEYAVQDSAAPIRARDGATLGAVLVFHDVTETRQLAREIAHQASHDALTGLVNRREFQHRLDHAVASAKEHAGIQHVLCYLDLDQFKHVNDTAGHAAGDELLKRVAALLSTKVRARDTLARLGGDEFSLLMENCPLDNALNVAETLAATVRDFSFSWEGRHFSLGISIGLVPIARELANATEGLRRADVACYKAKELGRNRVHVYQREIRDAAVPRRAG
jgi:diguanylate cyclase (GGDEF)-like protein/PAS domain S-box-containing protein